MFKRDLLLHPTVDEAFKVTFLRRLYLDSLNLLSNPDFENPGVGDPDFWANWDETVGDGALANETTLVHEGNNAVKVTAGSAGNTRVAGPISVVPGKLYGVWFWTMGDGSNAGRYRIYDGTNAADIIAIVTTDISATTYALVNAEFVAPALCTSARLLLYSPPTDTGITYYDTCSAYLLN